jgi:hypothetical protein
MKPTAKEAKKLSVKDPPSYLYTSTSNEDHTDSSIQFRRRIQYFKTEKSLI